MNPDELVWSHVKRTGVARTPLRKAKNSRTRSRRNWRIRKPRNLSSRFFGSSVAYITTCE